MVMETPPCSGRPRAYKGAWRCLGFSLEVAGAVRKRRGQQHQVARHLLVLPERAFFIDNLLVRIHRDDLVDGPRAMGV